MMKVWLITGCSSGLGKEIAEKVLADGDYAAVTARQKEKVQMFEKKYPDRALALSLDLTRKETIAAAVNQTLKRFGRIDVLVNNAGHGYRAAIEEGEEKDVQEVFETNFFGPVALIKAVLPSMRRLHAGMIINVTSIGAVRGALGNGYYSAAKGALELASEALARETEHLGIDVMLVEPGAMRTGFFDERLKGTAVKISAYDTLADRYRKENSVNHHDQNGNPAKGAAAIVETAMREDRPFRLLLGSDAYEAAVSTLKDRLQEAQDWAAVSRQMDDKEKA